MDYIAIRNLCFSYGENKVFDKFDLTIEKGTFTTIIGLNGSGKSTLVKIMLGLLDFRGSVKIGSYLLLENNYKKIRKKIGVVFSNPDNQFVAETVMDDIAFTLENMKCSKKDINSKIKKITKKLEIEHLLNINPHELSGGEKQLVALACSLVHDPDILILDEALEMIEPLQREKVLDLLVELNKKGLTILNLTHDIEESLYGDDIIIIDKGKLLIHKPKEEVYKEEKLFKKLGIKLPFMVELSNRLMFYDLIKKPIYDMEVMVSKLWK